MIFSIPRGRYRTVTNLGVSYSNNLHRHRLISIIRMIHMEILIMIQYWFTFEKRFKRYHHCCLILWYLQIWYYYQTKVMYIIFKIISFEYQPHSTLALSLTNECKFFSSTFSKINYLTIWCCKWKEVLLWNANYQKGLHYGGNK